MQRGRKKYHSFNPRLRVGGDLRRLERPLSQPVSIHASAWEATAGILRLSHQGFSFNPRLRVGGDIFLARSLRRRRCFNPRLRVGGDLPSVSLPDFPLMFQSTPPRGRRGGSSQRNILPRRFNPRLRVGGERSTLRQFPDAPSFNPRLRVGGDGTAEDFGDFVDMFQSTPPRGRRPCARRQPVPIWRFNPRLRVGGDVIPLDIAPRRRRFQSTPPRGRRL